MYTRGINWFQEMIEHWSYMGFVTNQATGPYRDQLAYFTEQERAHDRFAVSDVTLEDGRHRLRSGASSLSRRSRPWPRRQRAPWPRLRRCPRRNRLSASPRRAAAAVSRADSDVVVVGGGPAGAAAALTLRRYTGHRVVLIERSSYGEPRVGETVSGAVESLLDYLGVPDGSRGRDSRASGRRPPGGAAPPGPRLHLHRPRPRLAPRPPPASTPLSPRP